MKINPKINFNLTNTNEAQVKFLTMLNLGQEFSTNTLNYNKK